LLTAFFVEILVANNLIPLPLRRGDVFTVAFPIGANLLIAGAVLDGAIGYGRPPADSNLIARASQPVKYWIIISGLFVLFNGLSVLFIRNRSLM
jgi:hypothetical protein